MPKKPKILVFCDYYLPGYKSGGGMRTIVNMVDRLNGSFDFNIVTRDHDGKLDKEQYKGVKINDWNDIRGAKVFYFSRKNLNLKRFRALIAEIKPDAIYVNSLLSTPSIIISMLRFLKVIARNIPLIIAPEGEISIGAMQHKALKKKLFLNSARMLGLHNNLIWKTCSEFEKEEVELLRTRNPKIFIAPNMSPAIMLPEYKQEMKPEKKIAEATLVFLSRFVRKKNFKWFLENMGEIKGKLIVDIIAPLEDQAYWRECEEIIKKLPQNIRINALGSIPYDEALRKMTNYHFFLLPTLSENFGHVYIEGLSAGCPIIASDRTPWRDLEAKGIGWDMPLEDPAKWNEILNYCIAMDNIEYQKLSENSRKYAIDWLSDKTVENANIEVLEYAINRRDI